MKFAVAAALAAIVSATEMTQLDYTFMRWVSKHSREYKTVEEYQMRKEAFAKIDEYIQT